MKPRSLVIASTLVALGCGDLGTLDVFRSGEPAPVSGAPDGVYFVERFDYHFPDEAIFETSGSQVSILTTKNVRASAAFVYVPRGATGSITVEAGDLLSETGAQLEREHLDVRVLAFFDRERPPAFESSVRSRLDLAFVGGDSRTTPGFDARGFHEDARQRLPLVPGPLLHDSLQLQQAQSQLGPFVRLDGDSAAHAEAGQGAALFWVTVDTGEAFELPQPRVDYRGSLILREEGAAMEIPLQVTVLDIELDDLGTHGRYVGPFLQTAGDFSGAFDRTMLSDVRERGMNAVALPVSASGGYGELAEMGFDLVVNNDPDSQVLSEAPKAGFEPYSLLDLFEPTTAEVEAAARETERLVAEGAVPGGAMTLEVAQQLVASAQAPLGLWMHAIATYELDEVHFDEADEFYEYLDGRAAGAGSTVAGLELHYDEVLNGYAQHRARVMYGFWLYRSGLDGAMPWGYSNRAESNPWSLSSHPGVAFPAYVESAEGTHQEMIATVTWEALTQGVQDLRLALTLERLVEERGGASHQERFRDLLRGYGPLYDDGDRVDYRQRPGDVSATARALHELLAELIVL